MTSISKNVYNDTLDDIVNKYHNTYHEIIKTKPVDVKSDTYINSSQEINDKNDEKVIKRKSDKLCVKWKDYNNSFNSWIDKKDIV